MKTAIESLLEENGWHRYYSETHWVHSDIKVFFEKANKGYWGSVDYTNYQMSDSEALDFYNRFQKK